MSDYKNFIQDFPARCGEILKDYQRQAKKNGREVTHLLAIAAAALPIPFERLRRSVGAFKHPSRDKDKYEKAAGKFANTSDRSFIGSELWPGEVNSWKLGSVVADDVVKGPDNWATLDNCALSGDYKVAEILEIVRNALAHGSIFTLPDAEDKIHKIVFLSESREGNKFSGNYIGLSVTPDDFTLFLVNWIRFLSSLKLS